jgi:hypothetical protein
MSIIKELSSCIEFRYKNRNVLINVIYFEREGSTSTIGDFIGQQSTEVFYLNTHNLMESRAIVSSADLDVLLYLAIGTEKFSYFLAHSRYLEHSAAICFKPEIN